MTNPCHFGQVVSHPHSDAGLERDHWLGPAQGDASKVPRSPPELMEGVLPDAAGRYTHWAAVGLFVYFGAKLLLEAARFKLRSCGNKAEAS